MTRTLYYVPIIHVESDLGSMGSIIDKRSADVCGQDRWEKHKKAAIIFWNQIEGFFRKVDVRHLKIYQDGLLADGEFGLKIVEEGAGRGSRNYKIILDLIKRGGELRKTEDVMLLKEEYDRLLSLAQTSSTWEKTVATIGLRPHEDDLLDRRDQFIGQTINQTLEEKETGVLFIGASHNVLYHLAKDVRVVEIKNCNKVRDYFEMLVSGKDDAKFDRLAEYLMSEVQLEAELS